jgi:cardiolipin synthase
MKDAERPIWSPLISRQAGHASADRRDRSARHCAGRHRRQIGQRATIGAARSTYSWLLKRGVEIYEYQPTKLHTKLFVVDDVVHIARPISICAACF